MVKVNKRKGSAKKGRNTTKPIRLVSRFHVRPLDPKAKCGAGTTVQHLFRIREEVSDGSVRTHLVFFDRHGWYCEHGRTCPAVPHAKRQKKHR